MPPQPFPQPLTQLVQDSINWYKWRSHVMSVNREYHKSYYLSKDDCLYYVGKSEYSVYGKEQPREYQRANWRIMRNHNTTIYSWYEINRIRSGNISDRGIEHKRVPLLSKNYCGCDHCIKGIDSYTNIMGWYI